MDEVSYGIHWLRYSIPLDVGAITHQIKGAWSAPLERGAFCHPRHAVHLTGAKLYFGNPNPDQIPVLECPGQVCERHAEELTQAVHPLGGYLTRFDVAADLHPADKTMKRWREARTAFLKGRCETRVPVKSFDEHRSHRDGDGWTAYYGARSSQHFTRVYTQRGPLRIEFEMKIKDHVQRALWPEVVMTHAAGKLWRSLGRYINWPLPWYQAMLEGETIELPAQHQRGTDFTKLVDNLMAQAGPNLWILQQSAFPLEDLARPPANPNGLWLEKMRVLSVQATEMGYDGDNLWRSAQQVTRSARSPSTQQN